MEALLSAGAGDSINIHPDLELMCGTSCLLIAVFGGFTEVVKLLLAAGPGESLHTPFTYTDGTKGLTPLSMAHRNDNVEILDALLDAGALDAKEFLKWVKMGE